MWNCAQCGEAVEDQFEACWKCGTARQDLAVPVLEESDNADESQETSPIGRRFFGQDPEPASVAGFQIRCEICRNDYFFQRDAQLHTAVASFFDLEWVAPMAKCLVCSRCGYIHWFLPP